MSNLRKDAAKARHSKKKTFSSRHSSKSKVCRALRAGAKCLQCGEGRLDYDGLLQLSCPICGNVASGGGFT